MSVIRMFALLLAIWGTANVYATARELGPNRWSEIPRIVAFGDVHGAYEQLLIGLKAAAVVDDQLNWSGGDTHLVSLGDLLDRGAESRRVMDLLIRLQSQAPAAGGRVHVVIGNHELMNLTGDLRYVAPAEFAAFAGDETQAMREAAFTGFLAQYSAKRQATGEPVDPDAARQEFDASFPPGYFAHRAHFGARGSYGAWLLRQPLLVVLNANVFVHGGLPPVAARMQLEEMNETFAADVAEVMGLGERLLAAGWVRRDVDLLLQDNLVMGLVESAGETADPELVAAARRFVTLTRGELFGTASPNWYRGTALCHATLEDPVLTRALGNLRAERVVMGHTPTSNLRVQQRLQGRALLADTGMLTSYYGGQPAPVVFTGADLKILYPLREASSNQPDYLHPLQMHGMSPEAMEEALATATMSISNAGEPLDESGAIRATIKVDDKVINVMFEAGSDQQNHQTIAAYQLSRLLNLNLVPVTVARAVEGRSGVIFALPTNHVSEGVRTSAQMRRSNWCGVGNDYQLMYAFDALIQNDHRTAENMIYDPQNWQLYLTGHGASFGTGIALPRYLAEVKKIMPGSLATDLAALDEPMLQSRFGEALSKRQLRALLKRRDRMLADWTEEPGQ